MNRYDYIDSFDRKNTPFQVMKRKEYLAIYNEIKGMGEDEQYVIGFDSKVRTILDKFTEYREKYSPENNMTIQQANAALRQALMTSQGRKMILGKMNTMLEDPPS